MIEGALQVGEDYLQARRLYTKGTKGTRVTAKAVQSLGDEMGQLSNLLKQVAKTLTNVKPLNRGSEGETSKMTTLCGKRSTPRHLRSRCPPPKDRLTSAIRRGSLQDPASRQRSNQRTDTAGRLDRLRGTPPASGRHHDGPVDSMGDGNRLCYHSPTASASYRKRSLPARSIWISEGSQTPLRLRNNPNQPPDGNTCWGSKGATTWRELLPTREGGRQGRHVLAGLQLQHESPQQTSLRCPLSQGEEASPPQPRRPGESGVHHQRRAVEVEGTALWVNFRPATFQRLMEQVLSGLHWKTMLVYLDDVIVISPDFPTHVCRLREVFEQLRGAGLKLKPSKCTFLQPEVKYL